MTVRWERRGLKVVRVEPPPAPNDSAAALIHRAADVLRRAPTFAERMAADLARRAALNPIDSRHRPPADRTGLVKGDQLRKARKRRKLTQREVALQFGLARQSVCECELGHRSVPPALAAWVRETLAEGAEP